MEASRAYTGPPVDVLLTNEWGQGVTAGMATPPDVDREHGSPVVKDVALQLQPRWVNGPNFHLRFSESIATFNLLHANNHRHDRGSPGIEGSSS